eukprot:CAMPEP_0202055456 /NCGR_PEP_ID=MMETSP0963-20130614/18484_1 /ASSEMBLY_ACC=CAM_ASM_000494 /TAXON_ID=4773 /ORGANISM="Schizochytrium aggregatum, Strain ATCC28209" /LENGTH=122 /DNA_ID=CAMNT_0048621065 /DNA_START=56 /DNA_END=420 /DNA_ORIENTATION=-
MLDSVLACRDPTGFMVFQLQLAVRVTVAPEVCGIKFVKLSPLNLGVAICEAGRIEVVVVLGGEHDEAREGNERAHDEHEHLLHAEPLPLAKVHEAADDSADDPIALVHRHDIERVEALEATV